MSGCGRHPFTPQPNCRECRGQSDLGDGRDMDEAKLEIAIQALRDILLVSRDREAFVVLGSRTFVKAEIIAQEALRALGVSENGQ
jgi:hypothetical protein